MENPCFEKELECTSNTIMCEFLIKLFDSLQTGTRDTATFMMDAVRNSMWLLRDNWHMWDALLVVVTGAAGQWAKHWPVLGWHRVTEQFCTWHNAEELVLCSCHLVCSTRLDSRTASSLTPNSRQPLSQGIVLVLELALIVSQGSIRGVLLIAQECTLC